MPSTSLKPGDRVVLHGLTGRKDLNGCNGKVKGYEAAKERYAVLVESAVDDKPLLLKLANLKLADASSAPVVTTTAAAAAASQIDFDALLAGVDFALLRTTLVAAAARPGAVSYAQHLKGAMPGGKTVLGAIVALVQASDGQRARVVQQACDALSKLCTSGVDMRHLVRGASAADALVDALRGAHGVHGVADSKRLEAGATARAAAKSARAAKTASKAAAPAEEAPRIVDVTDDDGVAEETPPDGKDNTHAKPQAVGGAAAEDAAGKPGGNGDDDGEDDAAAADELLVTRAACHALTNLANGDLPCKQAVVAAGGAEAIAAVMKACGSDEAVSKICVGALANIASGDAGCIRAMVDSGGVTAVIGAIRACTKGSALNLGDALLALANIACDKALGATAVADAGGVEALVAAVSAHARGNDPRMREWAGAALANLASAPAPDVREALIDGGAARAAANVMAACGEAECRALRHCVAVWAHLGRESDEGREACCSAGMVEATVKALLATAPSGKQGAAEFAEQACRAFATLAFGDAGSRARLREGGAQRALTVCVERFPRHAQVQEMGRALLAELAR